MAKKSRTAVLKRQREVKKAEKAAMKREKRVMREELSAPDDGESKIATADDLAGYGFAVEEAETADPEPPPRDGQERSPTHYAEFSQRRTA